MFSLFPIFQSNDAVTSSELAFDVNTDVKVLSGKYTGCPGIITKFSATELKGGTKTGMRPYSHDDGSVHFVHQYVTVQADKKDVGATLHRT